MLNKTQNFFSLSPGINFFTSKMKADGVVGWGKEEEEDRQAAIINWEFVVLVLAVHEGNYYCVNKTDIFTLRQQGCKTKKSFAIYEVRNWYDFTH